MNSIETRYWLIGIGMLVALIALGQFTHANTAFNIVDHQAAGSAATVNEIHADWSNAGVYEMSLAGMIGDLVFIGVYSWGAFRAGRSMQSQPGAFARALGLIAVIGAAVFCVTDYGETIAQIIQMVQNAGSDSLAELAGTMQPIKFVSFIATFFAVLSGLVVVRFSSATP